MPTDDWGGVVLDKPKTDDWGGIPVAEKDDWGGVPVDTEQVRSATNNAISIAGGPGSLAYANSARDSFNQDQRERDFFTDPAPPISDVISRDTTKPETLKEYFRAKPIEDALRPKPMGLLADPDPTMGQYTGAAAIGESTALDNPAIKTKDDITAAYTAPMISLPKPENTGVVSGATRGAIKFLEQQITPLNVALLGAGAGLPAAAQKVMAGGFAADMATHIPEQYRNLVDAAESGDPGLAAERAVETLGTAAMTILAGAHAGGRSPTGAGTRPKSLTQDQVDLASTRKQIAQYRKSIDETVGEKDGQRPVVPDTIDGLVITRNRLARDFPDQPENIQRDRQTAIDEIDDQLLRFQKEDVQQAEARVQQREVSPPQESAPASEQPATSTGRSRVFEQAQRETTQEQSQLRPEEAAPEAQRTEETSPAVESPVRGEVEIDPEVAKVVAESAERIADQVTKGQPTSVRDAARDAALENAMSSLRSGKPHNVSFMRKSAQTAAGEAVRKQGESLDAPVRESETSTLDRTASEDLTPTQEAARNDLIAETNRAVDSVLEERDAAIVRAAIGDKRTLEDVGIEFKLSREGVRQIIQRALPKLRSALKERGVESGYVGGPGAMGPIEALEMKIKSTGTKNAVVDAEREARGEEAIVREEPVSNQQAIEEARTVLEQNPNRADEIVQDLNTSTRDVRSISAADEAILMARKVDLMRQRTEQETIYGSGEATESQRAVAARELTDIEAKLNEIDQATYASGAEWGRMGQLRQRLLRQDYSMEAMERRARIQKGEALTPEERSKIESQAKEIKDLQDKLDAIQKQRGEAEATQASEQSFSDIVKKSQESESPQSRIAPRVLALAEGIVSRLDKAADAARQRITERLKNASAGLDPTVVYDVAVIGTSKLARASLDFAKWSAEMTAELGDWVKPYLAEAWKESDRLWKDEEKRLNPKDSTELGKVRKVKADAGDKAADVTTAISERAKAGDKPDDLRSLVQRLALETVKAGEKTREGLIDKVHSTLQKDFPDITREQTRDLISGYGDFKALSKDEAKVTLRGLKGEMQQIGKIEDIQAKQAPKKTGVERRTPTDEERRLLKEVNELKKKGGFEVVDPERQLKTSLDSIKTRLGNEIRDLETAIATQERITPKKNVVQYDAEARALKEQRDIKKAEYDALFPKEPLTQEQLIDRTGKALDRSITQLESDLKSGKLYGDKNARKLSSPEIEAKRARLEALKAERTELRDLDTAMMESKMEARLKSAIERAESSIGSSGSKRATVDTEKIADLKLQLEAIRDRKKVARNLETERIESAKEQRLLKAIEDASNPKESKASPTVDSLRIAELKQKLKEAREAASQSPEAMAKKIESAKSSIEKQIQELDRRLKEGDLATNTPQEPLRSNELDSLRNERDALKELLREQQNALKPKKTPEELALSTYKTRTATRIAEIQDRIARQDFAPKVKKELKLDQEARDLRFKAQKVKEEYNRELVEMKNRNLPVWKKALRTSAEASNFIRAIYTGFDLSAILNQGGFIVKGSALRPGAVIKSLKAMVDSVKSEEGKFGLMEDIQKRPNSEIYSKSKLYLADSQNHSLSKAEEAFMSRWLQKIELSATDSLKGSALRGAQRALNLALGPVRASERAYSGFLNQLRVETFDRMASGLQKSGKELSLEDYKSLADYVNNSTGRGNFGKFEGAGQALSTLFFSPRFFKSRLDLLTFGPIRRATPATRGIIAREYGAYLSALAAFYTLGTLGGGTVEADPRSSDFGKLKIGNIRIDPLVGLQQPIVFATRALTGETKNGNGVTALRDNARPLNALRNVGILSSRVGKQGQRDVGDVTESFVRSKLAPVPGAIYSGMKGKDYLGQKTTVLKEFGKIITPMSSQAVLDSMKQNGIPEATALAIMQILGERINQYEGREK